MRLPQRATERLDRSQTIAFTFEGRTLRGYEGDTVGSALYATGQRIFSRSFKYHRRRGLLCCGGHCPNCMMTVDGVPNVRVCAEPLREGAEVRPQNVIGSLERDLMGVVDKLAGPFTPPGFYYKTFIRPRRFWPLYEKLLRGAAGLGRVDPHARRTGRFDTESRRVDTLVVGGGREGLEASIAAASQGESVALVDEDAGVGGSLLLSESGAAHATELREQARQAGVDILAPARALGVYEGNLVPVDCGELLVRFRAQRVVVAAGVVEQPLVFPGNDLIGVMLPRAVRRLVNHWAIQPGERAVIITADDAGLDAAGDLESAGTRIVDVVDLRQRAPRSIVARGRRGNVTSLELDGDRLACDLVVASGSPQPDYALLAHAGSKIEHDAARGVFVPTELPASIEAVGAAAGEIGAPAVPAVNYNPARRRPDKSFVCLCEDQTTKDLRLAVNEGFDSIELSKRYTTVTMGPCQGRLCHLNSIRAYAAENASDEASIGRTTARPPWTPVSLQLLAGRAHEPARRTSLHHRHKEHGAEMMWTGEWRRPLAYGDPAPEVAAVHRSAGLIDVSTLGKILVAGPDAATFLERIYPNRFGNMEEGRIRYGVLTSDAGRIMDDGTLARLSQEEYYVTTTSTGAEAVIEWFEWWNAIWQYEVEIINVTGALAALNIAGPSSRELLGRLTDLDVSPEGFKYLDVKRAHVAGTPSLLLRIGFVGELGYEVHFPSPHAVGVWNTVLEHGAEFGIRPFGLEAQRILRLEKAHIIVGQDTDSESNLLEASMPWILKLDKNDFVGRWAADHVDRRGPMTRLVGFEMDGGQLPVEGGQIVAGGHPVGRVTSVRRSEAVGRTIGLAWVPAESAQEGAEVEVQIDGQPTRATVTLKPFYDAEGTRLRS